MVTKSEPRVTKSELRVTKSAAGRQRFGPLIVPPRHVGDFGYSLEQVDRLCRRLHFFIWCATFPGA